MMLAAVGILLGCWFHAFARAPTDFGDITNLPREYQLESLAMSEQAIVREALQTFEATAGQDPTKSFAVKIAELDRAVRRLLPERVRTSLTLEVIIPNSYSSRRFLNEPIAVAFYRRQFPDLSDDDIRYGIALSTASMPSDEESERMVTHLLTSWDAWERARDRHPNQRPLEPQLNLQLLAAAPIAMRRAGLAQLLWTHLRARQSANETIREQDYAPLFEGNREALSTVKRVVAQVERQPRMTARQIFLLLGLLAVPIYLYAMWRVPQAMARLPLWWVFCCLYRVRVNGLENFVSGAISSWWVLTGKAGFRWKTLPSRYGMN